MKAKTKTEPVKYLDEDEFIRRARKLFELNEAQETFFSGMYYGAMDDTGRLSEKRAAELFALYRAMQKAVLQGAVEGR